MRATDYRVSCVFPAYNEAANLPEVIRRWDAGLAASTRDYELIVVDDGSTDDTAAVLRQLVGRYERLRTITHGRNLGYGTAISNGFEAAKCPLVFFTDADGQYEPEDLGLLLDHIATADVVVGYRIERADPIIRRSLSNGYNSLVRHMVGLTLRDINCAFKLMRRDTFRRLGVEATGFTFNAELAANARRAGQRIVEVGVRHLPRQQGRSKVRPLHLVSSFYELVRVRARQRRVPAPDPTVRRLDDAPSEAARYPTS
jgi:glycosyltransferase involved in cell wall biosynthesis